jgi:formylglycine-generating enzyme required for sulfatase activity
MIQMASKFMADVFISYSKKDNEYVGKLTAYLENEGLSVWVDDRIDYGDRWWLTIVTNIRKCAAMVVVMTPEGEKSDWVQKEYFYANNLGKPLIPLLLKDECFPFFVTHQYHDVRDGSMPPKKFIASLRRLARQKHEEELKQKEKVDERRHRAKNKKKQKEELKRETIPKANAKSIGMEFVLIPAGSFIMGSPQSEKGRMRDENQHEVTISRPFYMQTTEVTQSQWEKVIGDNPSYFKNCGDDCPVDNVSWNDAQEFISMLNQIENTTKYRLPTEAEWEYACRAGTETAYSFNEVNKLGEYAWYRGNSDNQPQPVMQKMPNPWGLYDMYGNVWEWCLDWYGDYPSKSVIDQKGLDKGEYRVLRGGSWNSPAKYLRSAFRGRSNPDYRFGRQGGFRIVQDY